MPTLYFTKQQKIFGFTSDLLMSFISCYPKEREYYKMTEAFIRMNNPYITKLILEKMGLNLVNIDNIVQRKDPNMTLDRILNIIYDKMNSLNLGYTDYKVNVSPKNILRESFAKVALRRFVDEKYFELLEKNLYPKYFFTNPSIAIGSNPILSFIKIILRRYAWNTQDELKDYDLQVQQGTMEKVILKIGEDEFYLNLELLLIICDYYIYKKRYKGLASALLALNQPLISESIIKSELLELDELDKSWELGSIKVCRSLVSEIDFFLALTDKYIEDIIAINDIHMLCDISQVIHLLYSNWDILPDKRMSEKMRDKLMDFMVSQDDMFIKKALIRNSDGIPDKYLQQIKLDD